MSGREIDLHAFCSAMGFDEKAESLLKPHWAELLEHTEDGVPEFMTREVYGAYYPICNGPDGVLERMDAVADMLPALPLACRYASMLHYGLYVAEPQMPLRYMPAATSVFGENAGIYQLMVVVSSLPLCEKTYANLGLPRQYFIDVADKIGSNVYRYAKFHKGLPGYEPGSSAWTRHEVNGMLFRLGRLEFMISIWTYGQPVVYRNRRTGEYAFLCQNNWWFDANGLKIEKRTQAAFTAHLEISADHIAGTPLTADGYPAVGETRVLDFRDWECAVTPWDLVVDVHVPSGAPLTWDSLRDSFARAREFFPRYFGMEVKAFKCGSWLLNPNIGQAMPESNIAAFQRHVHLGPNLLNARAGIDFVYGRLDADPLAEPATTAMHRLFQKFAREKTQLIWGNMILMADEIPMPEN